MRARAWTCMVRCCDDVSTHSGHVPHGCTAPLKLQDKSGASGFELEVVDDDVGCYAGQLNVVATQEGRQTKDEAKTGEDTEPNQVGWKRAMRWCECETASGEPHQCTILAPRMRA